MEVVGEPAVLVGNSLGGYAAMATAAQHPDLVCPLCEPGAVTLAHGVQAACRAWPQNWHELGLGIDTHALRDKPWPGALCSAMRVWLFHF